MFFAYPKWRQPIRTGPRGTVGNFTTTPTASFNLQQGSPRYGFCIQISFATVLSKCARVTVKTTHMDDQRLFSRSMNNVFHQKCELLPRIQNKFRLYRPVRQNSNIQNWPELLWNATFLWITVYETAIVQCSWSNLQLADVLADIRLPLSAPTVDPVTLLKISLVLLKSNDPHRPWVMVCDEM